MAYYDTGYAPTSAYNSVKKVWDSMLHQQTIDRCFFSGMIGRDKTGEGDPKSEMSNFPIVEKTDLKKEAGDQITMSLVRQISTSSRYNAGKTGNTQLIDSESGLTFYNCKVLIGHYRNGVTILGKTTKQRSPFELRTVAKDVLSSHLATILDDGIFFALYSGYSFNVLREYGTTLAPRAAHPNIIYGKNKTALTNVDTTDVVDVDLLERLAVAAQENNINPIMRGGKKNFLFVVHPRGLKTLRSDSAWLDAQNGAAPRSEDNKIFSKADGSWAGIHVMEANQVDSAKLYSTLSVSSDVITLSADTAGAGITVTDIRMNLLLGANSVARAFGTESYMALRKEDDYGNIDGVAGGFVYGDKRADYIIDDGTGATTKNQSSILVYSHSPNLNSNLSAIWS